MISEMKYNIFSCNRKMLKYKVTEYIKSKKINLLALGLYTILTYLMVYLPVSINLNQTYLGHAEVVYWSHYFWWFDYAITNFINPLNNSMVFYPIGMDLVDSIFPAFLFTPITHIFGSVISYNLYVLSTFVLAGYGMFLLSKYLFEDSYIAFVTGIIFAFFPFHFGASLSHVHTFSIMWIPFFVLFFFKTYKNPTKSNIILSSLFFSINALTSWTVAVMLALFCAIYMLSNWKFTFSKKFFPKIVIFAILSLCFMSPGLYLIMKNMLVNENMFLGLNNFIHYSADLLGFVTPSPLHPLFEDFSNEVYSQFTGNYSENIVFIGYSVILLSAFGIYSYIKKKLDKSILFCLIIFFVLSLGPVLHVFGTYYFTDHNLTVMLPGILTKYLPFFNMIRVPSRYDIMVMFFFSIFAGYGLKYIFEKIPRSKSNKLIICCIISLVILFEFMAVLPTQDVKDTPDFYYSFQQDDNTNPIIEIPIIRSPLDSASVYINYYEYQKVHQKPMMGGYFNRVNPVYAEFMNNDSVLKTVFQGKRNIDIAKDSLSFAPLAYLKLNHGVSHVILHKKYLDQEDLNFLLSYLGDDYIMDNSVATDPLIIYNTSSASGQSFSVNNYVMSLDNGWHGLEYREGSIPTRWMSNNASIIVNSNENNEANLKFRAHSFYKPRTLKIYVNNDFYGQQIIPSTGFVNVSTPININKGENIILLHVVEGSDRPCDIPELNNGDSRNLSIEIQNVTVDAHKVNE
ncbi:hypothetical protein [Methanohalophilus sp. DAL1]|uniref:hypothetical protein n=1 Tax=Methanohalophilus sp. DAL1 TaxID=1864608 RepID=UPI0008183FD4|nr:hypothetical protein [Methanohalophilus sp. DAL1]OBZ34282.1 MAG: hypothetical protein A9957_04115 [Methanohalophilus sp. DAL1]